MTKDPSNELIKCMLLDNTSVQSLSMITSGDLVRCFGHIAEQANKSSHNNAETSDDSHPRA